MIKIEKLSSKSTGEVREFSHSLMYQIHQMNFMTERLLEKKLSEEASFSEFGLHYAKKLSELALRGLTTNEQAPRAIEQSWMNRCCENHA